MQHKGGCHCGNISSNLRLTSSPRETPLRACGCAFCRMHATRTVADPNGSFELWAKDWSLVELYRFGSRTADYMICRKCGAYIAAICETPRGTRAVVNVNCMEDRAEFSQAPSAIDYEGETSEARLSRRAAKWMPAVVHRPLPA